MADLERLAQAREERVRLAIGQLPLRLAEHPQRVDAVDHRVAGELEIGHVAVGAAAGDPGNGRVIEQPVDALDLGERGLDLARVGGGPRHDHHGEPAVLPAPRGDHVERAARADREGIQVAFEPGTAGALEHDGAILSDPPRPQGAVFGSLTTGRTTWPRIPSATGSTWWARPRDRCRATPAPGSATRSSRGSTAELRRALDHNVRRY